MTSAIKEQDLPIVSTGPDVTNLVKQDLESRAQKGVATYGRRLQPYNGRNALIDAYQEVLDLSVYVKQRLIEEETFVNQLDKEILQAEDLGIRQGLTRALELYQGLLLARS